MAKLPRPYIPLDVRIRVAMRQLGVASAQIEKEIERGRVGGDWSRILHLALADLAEIIGCSVEDLHLDHDPALCNRRKIKKAGVIVGYDPPANDPAHLIYRDNVGHDIKTRVRGDGALRSDLAQRRYLKRVERNRTKRKRRL